MSLCSGKVILTAVFLVALLPQKGMLDPGRSREWQ